MQFARDLWRRISLLVGVTAMVISIMIGAVVGASAGFFGYVDQILVQDRPLF